MPNPRAAESLGSPEARPSMWNTPSVREIKNRTTLKWIGGGIVVTISIVATIIMTWVVFRSLHPASTPEQPAVHIEVGDGVAAGRDLSVGGNLSIGTEPAPSAEMKAPAPSTAATPEGKP